MSYMYAEVGERGNTQYSILNSAFITLHSRGSSTRVQTDVRAIVQMRPERPEGRAAGLQRASLALASSKI